MAGNHLASEDEGLFRQEAIAYRFRRWNHQGVLLKSAPAWLRRTYWLIAVILAASLAYMSTARIDETATGPCVARPYKAGFEAVAALPASYAPRISRGMHVRLKWSGFGDSHEVAIIDRIDREPGGPVMVHAVLPHANFEAARRFYLYKDGLLGEAQLTVGSQPMIVGLLPGLKYLPRSK
ncbi:MAG: hypothetical protein JO340_19670 [Acidobacteriaceae bacterium]|nr:hypothetical protein [Acidobacteriaceae bacterium]